jgi:hypothetical protein
MGEACTTLGRSACTKNRVVAGHAMHIDCREYCQESMPKRTNHGRSYGGWRIVEYLAGLGRSRRRLLKAHSGQKDSGGSRIKEDMGTGILQ